METFSKEEFTFEVCIGESWLDSLPEIQKVFQDLTLPTRKTHRWQEQPQCWASLFHRTGYVMIFLKEPHTSDTEGIQD